MIYYSPIDGDARQQPVAWRDRTAFIMQQMGDPVPASVTRARRAIDKPWITFAAPRYSPGRMWRGVLLVRLDVTHVGAQ